VIGRRTRLGIVAGIVALLLAACAPTGSNGGGNSMEHDVTAALRASDLGITAASADTQSAGFGTDLGITVSIDDAAVSADLLRGILQTVVDAVDPDDVRNLRVHVYQGPQASGRALDVLTPAGELGFDTGSPNRPKTSFEQLMTTVVDVLGS